ncbi:MULTISPECIES: CpsD/CapB family tyrosine-protein kinase [Priestia]|uniref:CpsD/CapB family tyrosine-protein kinase n=1 Tax=Priestia TaxID=2800373 RepID=UPI001C8DC558|nr:CpsD/CapB family tyrosine-protein kinase [Priestia aryabhattai]MBY0213499.1 CpsD/CapB family tyrosine-protein kinase [Priestia aryabhattai]MDT0148373.1 CpsD/CapB family tyrosine-protein kinase [Priestia aryabhattai]MDT0153761.1 CpsD/CapB family tyrosine-protein kinase [Priestia aryabhattai]
MARNKKQNDDKTLTKKRRLIAHTNPKLPVAEQYRTIRSNVQFSSLDQDIRSLALTSSGPGEGKSTTAANLAIVYAQQGKRVLLVDADLRKPTAHFSFRLENYIGFTNVLTRKTELEQAVQDSQTPNLFVLTSGPIPPNPSELLASKNMDRVLQEMYDNFDFILFDTPPTLAVTDAQILSNKVEATILVVSSGKTDRVAAQKAKDLLNNANARLLGVILNNRPMDEDSHYYYYYGTN